MTITDLLFILGGVTDRSLLLTGFSRAELDRAVADGAVVRIARGRYALTVAHEGLVAARRAAGVVCLSSAALGYGWAVKSVPDKHYVAVPKHRRLAAELREEITPHWIDLEDGDVEGRSTTPSKTLEMCGRWLPYDEALAIADSALRSGFPRPRMLEIAAGARGPGSARLRRVAQRASGKAANPFESVLRAMCHDVPALDVEPQVVIRTRLGLRARCDLVDQRLRLVLEADSFEWHGDRAALRRDARRYDLLTVDGWRVLRFSWEDVMHDQEWVRDVLRAIAAGRTQQCPRCASAA